MDEAVRACGFGELLRRWRRRRGLSQLALSLDADVSSRHLSWLESGRATPSRAMVLRLVGRMDLPLRDRNAMLLAAGYAPLYGERTLADAALTPAREALQRLLDAHEPAPALAVDRHWNLLASNRMVPMLLAGVSPALLTPPVNVLRLSLHPDGLAPHIEGFGDWRAHVLQRLRRQVASTGDDALRELLDELGALPGPDGPNGHDDEASAQAAPPPPIVPLVLHTPMGRLSFVTTVTVFGAPVEVTLAELAVETLMPADADTAAVLQRMLASLG